MGCNAIEDTHHVFVKCKIFDELRRDACREIVEKTIQKIEAVGLEEAHFQSLLHTAKSIFLDCLVTWPLHYSFYYLGHIPKLDAHVDPNIFDNRLKRERFIHNISGDWHHAHGGRFRGRWQRGGIHWAGVEGGHIYPYILTYLILVRRGMLLTLS